jgi:hypothetical protein
VLLLACGAGAVPDPDVYATVDTIESGCSGGIMGFIQTVSVQRDGRVSYQRIGLPGEATGPERIDPARFRDWLERLRQARFLERKAPERERVMDGVACGLTLLSGDEPHSLFVVRGKSPREILAVFDEIQALRDAQADRGRDARRPAPGASRV